MTPTEQRDEGVVDLEVERRAALDRIKHQRDHDRVCAWLHQLAPLTEFYGPRRVAA